MHYPTIRHSSAHSSGPHLAGERSAPTTHDQLVKQTQKWVSQTFYGTLLKHMHDSPFKSKMFDGGRGGEAFSGLYDQQLADRMSRGVGSKLVNGLVRRIEAKRAYEKTAAGAAAALKRPSRVSPTAKSETGNTAADASLAKQLRQPPMPRGRLSGGTHY